MSCHTFNATKMQSTLQQTPNLALIRKSTHATDRVTHGTAFDERGSCRFAYIFTTAMISPSFDSSLPRVIKLFTHSSRLRFGSTLLVRWGPAASQGINAQPELSQNRVINCSLATQNPTFAILLRMNVNVHKLQTVTTGGDSELALKSIGQNKCTYGCAND